MKKTFFIIFILFLSKVTFCHNPLFNPPYNSVVNIGFGAGIDYAGLGGRFTILPTKSFGIFGMVGYNMLELAYGGGVELRLAPNAGIICPYITAMYGYNAVIKIEDASFLNKTYYGFSSSLGAEIHSKEKNIFFNIELIVPFRSMEYRFDLDTIENNYFIHMDSKPWPVNISLGLHFGL